MTSDRVKSEGQRDVVGNPGSVVGDNYELEITNRWSFYHGGPVPSDDRDDVA